MTNNPKFSSHPAFLEIFKDELETVRNREVIGGKGGSETDGEKAERGDGLPRFADHLLPENERSNALNQVLTDLMIDEQRQKWQAAKDEADKADRPMHDGLVGLAFSGGGIRSATFNLGILQALDRVGLFRCVDYLSTVSGGGYIGSCLSSLMTGSPEFPFRHVQGEKERAPFRHLRNNANYLAPRGLFDALKIPALMFRGILINFLVVLPYILAFAGLTVLVNRHESDLKKNMLWDLLVPSKIFGFSTTDLPFAVKTYLFTEILFLGFILVLIAYPIVQLANEKVERIQEYQWTLRDKTSQTLAVILIALFGMAFIETQPLAVYGFHRLAAWLHGQDIDMRWLGGIWTAITFLVGIFGSSFKSRLSKLTGKIGIYVIAVFGFLLFWLIYLFLCRLAIVWENGSLPRPDQDRILLIYAYVTLVLSAYSLIFVDMNQISLHNFYRDRLSKAYLIKQSGNTITHNDVQRLSELDSARAPYHLINAALNSDRSEEAYQKGRHADFFLFSKHFIGSRSTGYIPTAQMEGIRPHVNLGTAMAISGAAAAANMGKVSIKPLSFILAMLNVRLNYWLPNPARIMKGWKIDQIATRFYRVGPAYLIAELFGGRKSNDMNINISDGGHIENLGIYELLARECRLIIAGDGESDPELEFDGLAEVIRMAQIDLGIRIEMKGLDAIRHGQQHHAIGTIHYSGGRTGKLIYLKSSLLGDDTLQTTLSEDAYVTSKRRDDDRLYDLNPYIARYKAKYPDFPHETTADQFFDETQFECYRALGFAIGMRALSDYHFRVEQLGRGKRTPPDGPDGKETPRSTGGFEL